MLPERGRLDRRSDRLLHPYWRREFYLVTAGYAVLTIVAFFAMGGRFNTMSIVSKLVEAVVALAAGDGYTAE